MPVHTSTDSATVLAGGVCVVGMHRSGTSLTTQVLARLGMEIGPDDGQVATIPDDNPDGYAEQRELVAFDDALLLDLGGQVSDPPAMPERWWLEERFATRRAQASHLLAATFDGDGPWGFKDPRASLLLTFWRAVVPGMRVVICLRSPAEVADSMQRRDPEHFSGEHWARMWERHTVDALQGSSGADRIAVVYEDLVREPEREAARLGAFLHGVPADPVVVRHAAGAVRPEVRRGTVTDAELARDERVAPGTAGAYLAIRALVRDGASLEDATRLAVAARDAGAAHAQLTAERERRDVIERSRSWRLTYPLREAARRARARAGR